MAFVAVCVGLAACSAAVGPRVELPAPTVPSDTTTTFPIDVDLSEPVVRLTPGVDLSGIVEAAHEGTTFILGPGLYRTDTIVPKAGMTFSGAPDTVISGAFVLDGWRSEGDRWRLDGIAASVRDHGRCIADYEGCSLSQDLFMDDVMLWQVTDEADLRSGTWMWDGDSVLVADDPTVRRVELSVVDYAFVGSADDVTLESIVVEKFATPAQEGAVQAQEPGEGDRGRRWTLRGVEVRFVHGAGVRAGDDTVIDRSYIHHNGQLGITGAGGTGLVITESEIAENNVAGFSWEWEAGGVKITNSTDVTLSGNHVHHNRGPGLWGDLDNVGMVYVDNISTDNTGPGIFHEISGAAVIDGNTVERNGSDKTGWLWGAGILIAGSWDVEVSNNIVRDNANAITGVQQDRGEGPHGERLLRNLFVHHNTIDVGHGHVGIAEDVGDDAVFTERHNRFETNTYVGGTGRSFAWLDHWLDRTGWQYVGQDVDGVWVGR
ncbi:MAG: right-handed parallel beta-helix repeat-containing protein [Acidimicrobiia bacterium]|nr:right-handed parallel beta-helix repeat-containing protein [Acidimicrobiia bacterium]